MKTKADYKLPVEISGLQYLHYQDSFGLESGYSFDKGITIAFHTYGELNADRNNVIWVCHALTANSRVDDWWSGLFGEKKLFDPSKYFIVCANVLGSCYGTTGARSIDAKTQQPFGMNWPLVTVRDWVKAHELLRQHLGIEEIALCIGGSCGGHQVLEFSYLIPDRIRHIGLLVTSARESAWAIAGHEAQRLALQADPTLSDNTDIAGAKGMKAARGMALLGYRTIDAYIDAQTDRDDVLQNHLASSYIRHQGEKLEKRFYAHCYYHMIGTLDTHHLGRDRGSLPDVLNQLTMQATVVAIDSDRLIPAEQQIFLAEHLPNANLHIIHSPFGHDGFLIETEKINSLFLC
ncbi:MAG TPA: homoserine O-acetyltransferase [Saprospiraceae bacterium]|nr:homoserine O-acetyltransferase [Saprospiraceae bacterium]